jgi:vacuolar-type H+-ATPase subunit I/STV1
MRARFVIGYVLLALGLLGSIYTASIFIRLIFAPPTGDIIGGLGAGLAWASYLAFSILFIIPGAILVRKHESFVRRAIGIIVILLGIIPQAVAAVAYLHSTLPTRPTGPRTGPPPTEPLPIGPAGPSIEILAFLAFFLIPLVLYLVPGILLALPSRSSQ